MQRSLFALTLLAGLVNSGCGSHDSQSSPRPVQMQGPRGLIEIGLDRDQVMHLVPEGSTDLPSGQTLAYKVVAGHNPTRIVVNHENQIKVTDSFCEAGVCTIAYRQTLRNEVTPSIEFQIVDESGYVWSASELTGLTQKPVSTVSQINVALGEKIQTVIPLKGEGSSRLTEAPIISTTAVGGKVDSAACTQEKCTVEFTYEDYLKIPVLTVNLSSSTTEMPAFTMRPAAETFTYQNQTKQLHGSPSSLRLIQGVDYISSWKRPATAIVVQSAKGMETPSFTCAKESCISTAKFINPKLAEFAYSINSFNSNNLGKISLEYVQPRVTTTLQELTIDSGADTEITLSPGKGYISDTGVPAVSIKVETLRLPEGLAAESKGCDALGNCTLKVRLRSNEPFASFDYSLKFDNFTSARQTLKLISNLRVIKDDIHLWRPLDREVFQEVVLKPGKDYVSGTGAKATGVISTYLSSLEMKESAFVCDSEGVCRAWVRPIYQSLGGRLSYAVKTATGTSAEVVRSVLFDSDRPVWTDRRVLDNVVSKTTTTAYETFKFQLVRGKDYTSQFPATKVRVNTGISKVDFPAMIGNPDDKNQFEAPCDAEGTCSVEGFLKPAEQSTSFRVTIENEFGVSLWLGARVVPNKYSKLLLNLPLIQAQQVSGEDFTVTLESGAKKGYEGASLAKLMQVTRNNVMTEYTCTEGRCTFPVRAMSFMDSVDIQLFDGTGHSSLMRSLRLDYPQPLAISQTSSIRDDSVNLSLSIPTALTDTGKGIEIDPIDGVTTLIKESGQNYSVELTLDKPLPADAKPLVLNYRLKQGAKVSNTAQLIFQSRPVLRLNTGATAKAILKDRSYQVTISYAEHFQKMLGTPVLADYFSKDFVVYLPPESKIISANITCMASKAECTMTFARPIEAPQDSIKVEIYGKRDILDTSGIYVDGGELTIQLN